MLRIGPRYRSRASRRKASWAVLSMALLLQIQGLSLAREPMESRLDAGATHQVWAPGGSSWSSEREEPTFLVGVVVHGREKGSAEVVRQQDVYLLPLATFALLTGSRVDERGVAPRLVTSLGEVDLRAGLIEVGDVLYLDPEFIESELATSIEFDESEFALRLNPP